MSEVKIPYSQAIAKLIPLLVNKDPTPGDQTLPQSLVRRATQREKGVLLADLSFNHREFLKRHPQWWKLFGFSDRQKQQACSGIWKKYPEIARDVLKCPRSETNKKF